MTNEAEDETPLPLSLASLRHVKRATTLSRRRDRAPASPWPRAVSIFDAEAVRRQLSEAGLDTGYLGDPDEQPLRRASLTIEEEVRVGALERLGHDPRGHSRPPLLASPAMIERLEALRSATPHFAPVLDLVLRAAHLSVARRSGCEAALRRLNCSPMLARCLI